MPASGLVDSAGNPLDACRYVDRIPGFAGQDQVPRIAGQREDYLVKTLREYKSGERRGYDPAMASVVAPLNDQDFVDLAYYLSRVK